MFHSCGWDPGIFGVGVTLPFDQILDAFSVLGKPRFYDGFYFVVVCFSFDDVWGWSGEVWSVGCRFFVRAEEGIVEDWVDAPGLWEVET
jgi:hypothetical protein